MQDIFMRNPVGYKVRIAYVVILVAKNYGKCNIVMQVEGLSEIWNERNEDIGNVVEIISNVLQEIFDKHLCNHFANSIVYGLMEE